jgi:hypothetical protein
MGFLFWRMTTLPDGPGNMRDLGFGLPFDLNSTFSLSLCKARRKPLHENDSIALKENPGCTLSFFNLRFGERLMRLELGMPL